MTSITEARMKVLLAPFVSDTEVPENLYAQLIRYLALLKQWSGKTNLTTIHDPLTVISRHFGECLFLGRHLPFGRTLLDYGSGAGFPGLPVQLLLPDLHVTLAESQGKKVSFLREAVRVLNLNTEVWGSRVEAMPAERRFDLVALRAVDKMDKAIEQARLRAAEGGTIAMLISGPGEGIPLPGSKNGLLRFVSSQVPRGTYIAEDTFER